MPGQYGKKMPAKKKVAPKGFKKTANKQMAKRKKRK